MAGKIDVAVKIWVNWALAKKLGGKLIKMHVFLGFEPILCSNREAERRVVVPKPQMLSHMAGTIDVAVRIWVYWPLAKSWAEN